MTFASLFQAVTVVFSMFLMLALFFVPRDKDGNILKPPKILSEDEDRRAGRMLLSFLVMLVAALAIALKVS